MYGWSKSKTLSAKDWVTSQLLRTTYRLMPKEYLRLCRQHYNKCPTILNPHTSKVAMRSMVIGFSGEQACLWPPTDSTMVKPWGLWEDSLKNSSQSDGTCFFGPATLEGWLPAPCSALSCSAITYFVRRSQSDLSGFVHARCAPAPLDHCRSTTDASFGSNRKAIMSVLGVG